MQGLRKPGDNSPDCTWTFLGTAKESMSFLLIVNWHLWAWLTNICVGQSMFIYICFCNWSKQITQSKTSWSYIVISLLLLCLHLYLPKIVPVKEHISCVLSQTQSIWLGCIGKVPSLTLDNSKSQVFSTMACSLEELQGRMLMGPLLHLCKTLSAEWIQTQTTQICQFLGIATVKSL